ncbi:MAG: hypothetical protein WC613_00245 [Candidatus Aenigmatarchaeota archaeon]
MPTQAEVSIGRKFDVPKSASVYPLIGKAYTSPSHSFSCSPTLVRTDKNYYDSLQALAAMIERGELSADTRFMTQAEGLGIENSYKRQGKDPRKADEFRDYFAKNRDKVYLWEWTSTGLRVPKGWEKGRVDSDGKYPRIIIETDIHKAIELLRGGAIWQDIGDSLNRAVGELRVPSGGGKVIVESDEVFGIPTEARDIAFPHEGYHSHWHFNAAPELDTASGQYDVAVLRGGYWRRDERCLNVDADYRRWDAGSADGFRPVRGSVPEIDVFRLVREQR